MTTNFKTQNYAHLIQALKQEIGQARIRAHLAVNKEMIMLYWNIGKKILERQTDEGWGTKVIESISNDLRKEFPEMKGLSARNLLYMQTFAATYPSSEITQHPVAQIPWGHNVTILDKINLNNKVVIINIVTNNKLNKFSKKEIKLRKDNVIKTFESFNRNDCKPLKSH